MTILPALLRASLLVLAATALAQAAPFPDELKVGGFAVGCQAYTFNRFTLFEAIDKTASTGAKVIEFATGQKLSPEEPTVKFNHEAPPEVWDKVKAKLAEKGLTAVAYGVVALPKEEALSRKVFEFAKYLGFA